MSESVMFQEMEVLEENDVVYKLIGPALIRQDLDEAKSSVEKRIEYITNEMLVTSTPGTESRLHLENLYMHLYLVYKTRCV